MSTVGERLGAASPSPTATAVPPDRAPAWQLYLCCTMLVACTIPWRGGVYFSGALDPIVVLKGLIGSGALVLAFSLATRHHTAVRIGTRTLGFASAYLIVSVIGGWAAGVLVPSLVVAVRVGMLLGALAMLMHAVGVARLVQAMARTMAAVALLAVVTGAGTLAATGRLRGGIPPLAHNEVAFLCGVFVLLTVQRMIERRVTGVELWLAGGLLTIVWLTGSRTGFATLMLAAVLVVVQARTISVPVFLSLVMATPVVAYAVLGTEAVTGMLLRGGDQNVTTLSSRTIAWEAALTMDMSTYQRWFGGGLTLKHIPVAGQYWETQLLDSSWISALVQTGVLGLALVGLWVLVVLVGAMRSPRPWRPLWVAFTVFVTLRSLLESGLFDASTSFIVFVLVSLASEPGARVTEVDPPPAEVSREPQPVPS